MTSSAHVDNKKKDILILGKSPRQGLDDTMLTSQKEYIINFTEQNKKLRLSLHYNGVNSYLFVNGVEIYKFKAKDSEINSYPVCLGNIQRIFKLIIWKRLDCIDMFMIFQLIMIVLMLIIFGIFININEKT